jgi:hypothetical protein
MQKSLVWATLALCLAPAVAEARGFKVKIKMPGSTAPAVGKVAAAPAGVGAPRGALIIPVPRLSGGSTSQQTQSTQDKAGAATPQSATGPVLAARAPAPAAPPAAVKPPPPAVKTWAVPTFGANANAPHARDIPGFQDAY